jgi:hypothetical protein
LAAVPCHPCVSTACNGVRVSLAPRFEDPCHACATGLRCGTSTLLAQVPVPPLRLRHMQRLTRVTGHLAPRSSATRAPRGLGVSPGRCFGSGPVPPLRLENFRNILLCFVWFIVLFIFPSFSFASHARPTWLLHWTAFGLGPVPRPVRACRTVLPDCPLGVVRCHACTRSRPGWDTGLPARQSQCRAQADEVPSLRVTAPLV